MVTKVVIVEVVVRVALDNMVMVVTVRIIMVVMDAKVVIVIIVIWIDRTTRTHGTDRTDKSDMTDRTHNLTFKLDFRGNLCGAAFAILVIFYAKKPILMKRSTQLCVLYIFV